MDRLLDNKDPSPELLKLVSEAPFSRKPFDEKDILKGSTIRLSIKDISCFKILGPQDQEDFETDGFYANYKIEPPQYHIWNNPVNKKFYLIDTQGFNYCRYVCRIIIKREKK